MFIIVLLSIAGICYFGATHYTVNTSDGIKFYSKGDISFNDVYIDMTTMNFLDLRHHLKLVSVMASHNDLKYVPGGENLLKLQKAGRDICSAISAFDNELQLSNSLREVTRIGTEKYNELNEKYDLEKKAKDAAEYLKDKANKLNKWLKKQ